jgi:hypothetical protein
MNCRIYSDSVDAVAVVRRPAGPSSALIAMNWKHAMRKSKTESLWLARLPDLLCAPQQVDCLLPVPASVRDRHEDPLDRRPGDVRKRRRLIGDPVPELLQLPRGPRDV